MLTSSKLQIAGHTIEYDHCQQRWFDIVGAYSILVYFDRGQDDFVKKSSKQLEKECDIVIQISKFGTLVGIQTIPGRQDYTYVENMIASMIRDFNAQNSIIEQWALDN